MISERIPTYRRVFRRVLIRYPYYAKLHHLLVRLVSDALATPVAIKLGAKNKGQLIIDFSNLDVLDDLIASLRAENQAA